MGAFLVLGLSALVNAGTLSLGTPVIQNNQYTFPVNLQGNSEGVAALDFRLSYDPAVFSPVSAQTGTAAVTAQKQVSSNVAEPGEFVVVMMGFNQNAVQSGTVVHVVLEKIGEPANGQSELLISEPTMATYEGVELDSNGQARVVRFGEKKTEDDATDESAPTPEDTKAETPPENDTPSPSLDTSRPTGSFRFIVAEDTENKAKAAGAPQNKDGGGTSSAARASEGLPAKTDEGEREVEVALENFPAGGNTGPTAMAAATESVLNVAEGADGSPNGAVRATGGGPGEPLAKSTPNDKSGNNTIFFATLLLVAGALPLSALVVLKALR